MELIENVKSYTMEDVLDDNPGNLLRYRYRLCRLCGGEFDIMKSGIFYRCGCQ